jgi:hypothetical protein
MYRNLQNFSFLDGINLKSLNFFDALVMANQWISLNFK